MKYSWLIFSCAIFLSLSVLSCASTGGASGESNVSRQNERNQSLDAQKSTSLSLPARRGYFHMISDDVISDVAVGTEASLARAADAIRSSGVASEESGKVLLYIISSIMQYVWQGRFSWEAPSVGNNTPYAGAISSVKAGVYDLSTGNVDFFAMLLPSLVIPDARSVEEFFASAEKSLLACIKERPDSVVAHYLLGLLYQKNGNYERAINYLQRASEGDSGNSAISYAQAVCYERTGKYDEAEKIASALLLQNSSDVNFLKLSTQIAFAQKNWDRAEEYVGRVLQREPNNREYVLMRIRVLMEKGDYVRASSLLDVYARQDSNSRDYLLLRARLQYNWSRNTSAAISTIEQALARYPNDPEVLLFAADISANTGGDISGKSAQEFSKRILETDGDNSQAREYAVRGMMQAEDWEGAYAESSKLLAENPDNKQYKLLRITICLAISRNTEAWNLAQELYRAYPSDVEVLRSYISVLVQTGRTSDALALINANINTSDADLRSFMYYRRSFLRGSQDDQLADLRSSLIANPRNNDALFRLYQIYFNQREYRRAQYYLRQVVALNPDNAYYRKLNEDLNSLVN